MALEIPNLDDRRWVDLVEEARSLIPRFAPLWTDHNAHDPGMTFIELFAWLAEMQIYQLNRVGLKHREGFSKLVGIDRGRLTPARVDVRVEGPVNRRTFIPAGTQLTPLEGQEIVFETLADQLLTQSRLERVIVNDGSSSTDQTKSNEKPGIEFLAFGENAREGAQLILGFNRFHPDEEELRLTAHLFADDLVGSCGFNEPLGQSEDDQQTTGSVDLVWEYLAARQRWLPLNFEDQTEAFSRSGAIILSVPRNPEPVFDHYGAGSASGLLPCFWIRARIREGHYDIEPRLRRISVNVLSCAQRETVRGELLGEGTGRPDQSFELAQGPVLIPGEKAPARITSGDVADWNHLARKLESSLPTLADSLRESQALAGANVGARYRRITELNQHVTSSGEFRYRKEGATPKTRGPCSSYSCSENDKDGASDIAELVGRTPVVIEIDNELWRPVLSFDDSGPNSKHYVFDPDRRCVEFGNGLNGKVPNAGQEIRAVWYRASNGRSGNVARGLKWRFRNFGIPGVEMSNPEPATGGSDLEPLNEMELRARGRINRSQRAVTLRDFERLALSTPNAYVARAKALTNCPVPESITVVAVPKVRPGRKVSPQAPSNLFLRRVERRLQQSRLLCDNIRVVGPDYIEVRVSAKLRLAKGAGPDQVKERALKTLNRFLKGEFQPSDQIAPEKASVVPDNNPLSPCPTLWPFGRAVFPSEVYAILDGVTGVDFAYDLELSATKNGAPMEADKTGAINVPRAGIVLPGQHSLTTDSDGRRNA